MRGRDEMGGFRERQGVWGGGGYQMVVLHNPTPQGRISEVILIGREAVAFIILLVEGEHTHTRMKYPFVH